MSEHLSEQQLERYRQRTIPPAELITATDHLAICEACRQQLGGADQLRNAFVALGPALHAAASREPAHLLPEQMSEYVANEMDAVDRDVADSHLEFCEPCNSEIRHLRKLKTSLVSFPVKDGASVQSPARSGRLPAFRGSPAYQIPLQVAAALTLLLVCLFVFMLRRQVVDLRAQVSELQRTNEVLQNQAASVADLQSQLAQLQQAQAQLLSVSPEIVVALYDGGGLVTLDKQGNLAGLKTLPPSYEQLTKTALTTQHVKPPPTLAELIGKPEKLMGGSAAQNAFSLLTPVGTILQTDRPTFRWSPLGGATSYTVTIYDADAKQVATSQPLSATEWSVPTSLARGGLYSWEVTAIKEGKEITSPTPPALPAKFKVLEQAKLDEINHAKQTYPNAHLILGILYAQAGLLDDAEREFKALVVANPHSSVANQLLRSSQSLRSRS
ncbi:MAG: hypothetical protein V7641_4188 [Blastocatellia bacterium]